MKSKQSGIVYIDRNRIDFYQDSMPSILSIEFPSNVIRDLEVINQAELNKSIKSFIEGNKLFPANVIVVLANTVIFEKQISPEKHDEQQALVQAFLDQVPFEEVSFKLIPYDKGIRIMAINSQFISDFKTAFESSGFLVEGVVAHSEVNTNAGDRHNLDLQEGVLFLKNFDSLKQLSFVLEPRWKDKKENTKSSQPQKNQLPLLLLIIFFILIGALFFFLFKKSY